MMNAAAGNTVTTAEHTWAMSMALARQIPQAALHEGRRLGEEPLPRVELMGKTLGIIGLGRIGSAVAGASERLRHGVAWLTPLLHARSRARDRNRDARA